MEFWKKEKRILTGFGIFLAFMFLCTLISRAVYASLLPQVTVEKPERTALGHRVEAGGIVRQGQEYAVYARAGIRVRTVCCQVGDRVTADTVLFELDTEDLKEQIKEQELAIQKLKLQLDAQEQNKSQEDAKRQTDVDRAKEDYARAESRTAETVERAEEDLENARDVLSRIEDHPVQVTSEEERQAGQKAYEDWVQKEAELKTALEQAENAWKAAAEQGAVQEKEAKAAYDEAAAAYEAHCAEPVEKPDYSGEDQELAAWQEQKEAAKDAVESAKRAEEDARQSREDALLEAGRTLDDADTQESADSSLSVNRLELQTLSETLEKYQELLSAEGKVCADTEGIVTRIQVSAGERTPDGAAVVYADLSSPLQFCVSLTKEQKKYVNQGDEIRLTLGGNSPMEATADYVAENELDPSLYDVTVFLPENTGTIGESGTLEASVQSEMFSRCIPMEALHEDSTKRNFVYVVSEREGILGKELAAALVYVQVLDQNEKYAAIEEGVIDQDTEIIVSSTEELSDRAVIRYKE